MTWNRSLSHCFELWEVWFLGLSIPIPSEACWKEGWLIKKFCLSCFIYPTVFKDLFSTVNLYPEVIKKVKASWTYCTLRVQASSFSFDPQMLYSQETHKTFIPKSTQGEQLSRTQVGNLPFSPLCENFCPPEINTRHHSLLLQHPHYFGGVHYIIETHPKASF